jgi:hypothetical protein
VRTATTSRLGFRTNLSGAIVMLLAVPVFAVSFGALGAWLATHAERAPR